MMLPKGRMEPLRKILDSPFYGAEEKSGLVDGMIIKTLSRKKIETYEGGQYYKKLIFLTSDLEGQCTKYDLPVKRIRGCRGHRN